MLVLFRCLHAIACYFNLNILLQSQKLSHGIKALHITYENSTQHQPSISSAQKVKLSSDERIHGCRLGMDSHADISCVGKHARILEVVEGQTCTVHPFNDSYEPLRNVRTVNAAFAIEDSKGHSYILKLNKALDFSASMEHSILCTNQARYNNVIVDDVPTNVDWNQTSSHSVIFSNANVKLPLFMKG